MHAGWASIQTVRGPAVADAELTSQVFRPMMTAFILPASLVLEVSDLKNAMSPGRLHGSLPAFPIPHDLVAATTICAARNERRSKILNHSPIHVLTVRPRPRERAWNSRIVCEAMPGSCARGGGVFSSCNDSPPLPRGHTRTKEAKGEPLPLTDGLVRF